MPAGNQTYRQCPFTNVATVTINEKVTANSACSINAKVQLVSKRTTSQVSIAALMAALHVGALGLDWFRTSICVRPTQATKHQLVVATQFRSIQDRAAQIRITNHRQVSATIRYT
ncbi:hypothetical protein IFR04_016017 [Cadophora malorum]|uniref:Uncharacterized protein n=1 Tax=Cadophora malorum TaxID=108018 RepID=A0A8H7VXY2_9HELO|nr:hypothetical protein IFR04_016017 [Cadophora malorum]